MLTAHFIRSIARRRTWFEPCAILRRLGCTAAARPACVLALSVIALACNQPARAHWPGQSPHQFAELGDLQLESGEVIKNFRMSYRDARQAECGEGQRDFVQATDPVRAGDQQEDRQVARAQDPADSAAARG